MFCLYSLCVFYVSFQCPNLPPCPLSSVFCLCSLVVFCIFSFFCFFCFLCSLFSLGCLCTRYVSYAFSVLYLLFSLLFLLPLSSNFSYSLCFLYKFIHSVIHSFVPSGLCISSVISLPPLSVFLVVSVCSVYSSFYFCSPCCSNSFCSLRPPVFSYL